MTAIVGTINRRGVAFAADSAATHTVSSKHKITNHANKILSYQDTILLAFVFVGIWIF